MAKRIRISDDSGSNWYTLPGNSGEFRNSAGEIVDTVFGQDWKSGQPGMLSWSIIANAIYKGYAGYVAVIKKQGSTTSMTAESMSLVSGKTYQIDAAAKQVWDHSVSLVFKDGTTVIAAADIDTVDYLFGKVTFVSSYTVAGAVTVDSGSYFPLATFGKSNSFSLTQTADSIDDSDFTTAAANGGYRTFSAGLRTVALELGGVYALANAFLAGLQARSEWVIEINPEGSSASVCRGFFNLTSQSQSGDVGALEDETVQFQLNVPDKDDLYAPFNWNHSSSTTLNTAVQKSLTAWQNGTTINAEYLENGAAGESGSVIVTEISLAGGLEVMNEFNITLQGSGTTTTV